MLTETGTIMKAFPRILTEPEWNMEYLKKIRKHTAVIDHGRYITHTHTHTHTLTHTHTHTTHTHTLSLTHSHTHSMSIESTHTHSMFSYRQALKAARTEHIHKLIENNKNNPRFLFSTVARLTNKQMPHNLNIPLQFNSNDFMNFFTDKIDNIRNTITNVDCTASSTSASFIAPKENCSAYNYRTG